MSPGADRTAVLVIDYQNDFCHPDGSFARRGLDVSSLQEAAGRTRALLEWAHGEGVPCIFALTEHSAWFDSPAWVARGRQGETLDVARDSVTAAGTWGAEPFVAVPDERDLVIVKHRYSAFAYTALELALRACEVGTLVVAGVTTNVCVRQTVMDAVMRGWRCVVVGDCTAAPRPREHDQALADLVQYSGAVAPLDRVTALGPDLLSTLYKEPT
jgi:ureidoacrylate peracid hydrolase